MTRPILLLPDDGAGVPGMLLIRADHDEQAWRDVLDRMGELPGVVTVGADGNVPALAEGDGEAGPRRLVTVDDPAWWGATPEEVHQALAKEGTWVPALVLMATDRTAATPQRRPLRAFRVGDDADLRLFRITPAQAALTYLVLCDPENLDFTFDDFEEWSPIPPERELQAGEDLHEWEAGLPEPVGTWLEMLDPVPRYTPPARPLPRITQENWGLLVRTDFSDEAAWARLLETVCHHDEKYGISDYEDVFTVVDDPAFDGATMEQVMAVVDSGVCLMLIADAATMCDEDQFLLAVSMEWCIGFTARFDPERAGSMMVNLGLANMDIDDFIGPVESA